MTKSILNDMFNYVKHKYFVCRGFEDIIIEFDHDKFQIIYFLADYFM